MRVQSTLFSLGAAACVLAACSAGSHEDPIVSSRQEPIVGGTNDAQDPAVVLIVAYNPSSSQAGESLGSGVIVSPHVIVTAAHVVDPATIGSNMSFFVFLGSDMNDPVQANNIANYRNVKTTTFDSAFDNNNLAGGHDVGVVVMEAASTIPPLPLNTHALTQSYVGQPIRYVGYGLTSASDQQGTSAGTKRTVTSTISSITSRLVSSNDPAHVTCEGDSGGPGLVTIGGGEVVAGLTSFGSQGCTDTSQTRVDAYMTEITGWINQFEAEADAGAGDAGASDVCSTCEQTTFSSGGACATQWNACMQNGDCQQLNVCFGGCQDAACFQTCRAQHATGAQLYDAANQCLCTTGCTKECAQACAAPAGDGGLPKGGNDAGGAKGSDAGTSGGSSGSGGAGGNGGAGSTDDGGTNGDTPHAVTTTTTTSGCSAAPGRAASNAAPLAFGVALLAARRRRRRARA